jgi:hypothetical protein
LTRFIKRALQTLIEFLTIVFLGVVASGLFALPWLIRVVFLFAWLFAAWFGLNAIQTIYSPFTDEIPLMSLKFALIFIQVAWLSLMLLYAQKYIWGGLAMGAIMVGGFSWLALVVWEHWRYANLFFRILPSALFSALLIYETIHLRSIRRGHGVKLSAPAFDWLGRKNQSTKGE